MELIKKLLFGRPITYHDSKIGKLGSRIKSDNPSKGCTWVGEYLLPGQKKETVFILEGNINGPYKTQLISVHSIVDSLESIIDKVDMELRKDLSLYVKVKDWKEKFYFAAITPFSMKNNSFELNFESIIEEYPKYVSFLWINGRIDEIEAK